MTEESKKIVIDSVEFEYVNSKEKTLDLLKRFDCVFPHLKQKISSYEDYAEKLFRYANVCVCLYDGNICGLLVYYANDIETKVSYISLIGVLSEWQGKKIGKMMLDHCVARCKINGMLRLQLEVDIDNYNAIEFYKRNGFVVIGNKSATSMNMMKEL